MALSSKISFYRTKHLVFTLPVSVGEKSDGTFHHHSIQRALLKAFKMRAQNIISCSGSWSESLCACMEKENAVVSGQEDGSSAFWSSSGKVDIIMGMEYRSSSRPAFTSGLRAIKVFIMKS